MSAIADTLGLNWQGLAWHAVNFIVLFLLLRQFLFKPVVGMLDARAQRVRDSMAQADQARRAAEQAEADRQKLLAETRREAEQIRARADQQAKRILADAEARANERQQQIEQQAEASARQIEERVMAQVRAQLADLVVTAVERVTRGALDANSQRGLVQQFLTTSGAGGASVVGVDRAR
jgi:F-type H+-transporting ATPase subunit b